MRMLQHENILPLLRDFKQFYEGSEKTVLVFPFCEEGDLYNLLESRNWNLSQSEIREIMRGILTGMAFLHSKNIVHRDIKSTNILMHEGVPRLGDFGLARTLDTSKRPLTPHVGTRVFFSPEMLDPAGRYGTATDVWSAGCLLFTLHVQNWPWKEGSDNLEQLSKIKRDPIDRILSRQTSLPTEVRSLLRRMLEMDAGKRISAKDALNHVYFTLK
jgi:serine/threonine protein kinase